MSDRKDARLHIKAEIGGRLDALFNDPAVQSWFKLSAENMMAAVLDARNDDERREAAAMARAYRDLRQFLSGAIDDGNRARRDLDRA